MKKILFAIILAIPVFGFSQGYYYGFGWNASYSSLPDLNFVIDEYNQVRPYLIKQMKEIHFLNGPVFSAGMMSEKSMIDIRWSFQHAVSSAQAPGTTVADPIERNLKVRCNKLSLGYGKAIVQSKLYVGALLNYGPVKVFTKVGNESDIKKTKYDLVNKNSTLGATVFVAWKVAFRSSGKGPGLVIRPFAELYFWGLDFSPYRTVVNPVQANTFPRVLLGRPTNVGISLQFCGFH